MAGRVGFLQATLHTGGHPLNGLAREGLSAAASWPDAKG
jgi:hypothetical protein